MDSDQELEKLLISHRQELRYEMPPRLRSKLDERLFSADVSVKGRRQKPWAWAAGLAIAASVAMAFMFQLGRFSTFPKDSDLIAREVVASHVRSLMVNHLSD